MSFHIIYNILFVYMSALANVNNMIYDYLGSKVLSASVGFI